METRAIDYLEVDSVPWRGMLSALVRSLGAIVAGLLLMDWRGPGSPQPVRVRARVTGRVVAQYEYGATEGADAYTHVATLHQRLAEMSLTEFFDDLGITLGTEELTRGH